MKGRQPKALAAISLPYQLLVRTHEPATLLTSAYTSWGADVASYVSTEGMGGDGLNPDLLTSAR
jgi:hypothetical protein